LNVLVQKTDSLAMDFVRLHPDHLFARMLYAVRPPEPPKQVQPTLKNGEPNPAFLRWVRDHYWDHTDFKAEELLNNSFWHIYFDNYFSRHVVLQPDSIIRAVDNILYKTPKNGAFYRFITLRITQYYEQKEAPGADRIFVHMVDRFLKKQETPWLDAATLERLWYKADLHRPNLTGSLAVNFSMPDETGTPVDLYGITAPLTVLLFYSPLCEHCMESMPNLYQVFLDFKPKGLAVLAINTDTETEYWRKFVTQQHWEWTDVSDVKTMEQLDKQYAVSNLPLIYVLDKDKKILAKRLRPADLGGVLQSNFDKIGKK
jgi:peroxiredoxin